MIREKLVRDRIPELLAGSGTQIRTARDATEYWSLLVQKLDEEIAEFKDSSELAELGDVLEIIEHLAVALGASYEELRAVQNAKRIERGGFAKRWIMTLPTQHAGIPD